ncbi:hypothetical protein V7201_23170 [Bacillus sp. JJ1122]|uniref:hypothetical protein n=1 Tax=Bacillus sp. JJ1122 TaxID=3122951 RepID=UPI002FFDCD79
MTRFINEIYKLRQMKIKTLNILRVFYLNTSKKYFIDSKNFNYWQTGVLIKEPIIKPELFPSNENYGIGQQLKGFSGFSNEIYACIEHGVYFGDNISPYETFNSGLPATISFGQARKNAIRLVSRKPFFQIGPYINYAPSLKKKSKTKQKNILYFPSHSIEGIFKEHSVAQNITKIMEIKNKYNYDNVYVCMYYYDILLGYHKEYEKYDVKIVTAGHRKGPYFLSRLKNLIEDSELTISNDLGTHVGYCVFLNKPHLILKQKNFFKNETDFNIDTYFRPSWWEETYKNEQEIFNKLFGNYTESVTDEQREICNKYWGFDQIKTDEEIRFILSSLAEIYKNSKQKTDLDFIREFINFIEKNKAHKFIHLVKEAIE